ARCPRRHACLDRGPGPFPQPRTRRRGRAAPIRGRASGAPLRERTIAPRARDDRDSDPAFPRLGDLRRAGLLDAGRETARPLAGAAPGTPIATLHGRMPADERSRVLADFTAGRTGILVATTVVEVGVDVPEATVMVIENAELFGLAQLHQLRGRVGRSPRKSWCALIVGARAGEEA